MSIQLSNSKKVNLPKEITVELLINKTKYIFKIENAFRFNIERIVLSEFEDTYSNKQLLDNKINNQLKNENIIKYDLRPSQIYHGIIMLKEVYYIGNKQGKVVFNKIADKFSIYRTNYDRKDPLRSVNDKTWIYNPNEFGNIYPKYNILETYIQLRNKCFIEKYNNNLKEDILEPVKRPLKVNKIGKFDLRMCIVNLIEKYVKKQ